MMTELNRTASKDTNGVLASELDVAPKSAVKASAKQFTKVLTTTPQYREFEQSYQEFLEDDEAQEIFKALKQKQESLRMMMLLNSVDEADRNELEKLENQFYGNPLVSRYLAAQEALLSACQQVGDVLSTATGLDFGTSCRVGGCCG